MPAESSNTPETSSALSWAGAICSVLGLGAVIVLQKFEFNNYTLLFWWITTAMIGIAAISACFTQPSLPLRAVFAIVFVAQLPPFNWAWAEIYERDTVTEVSFGEPTEHEKRIENLERENATLKWEWRETLLFWEAIAHLTGMGFALLGCTAGGQRRIRIVYDAS
jgi:hypothetical protein